MSYQSQNPLTKILDTFKSSQAIPADKMPQKPEEKLAWISEKIPALADSWRNVRRNLFGSKQDPTTTLDQLKSSLSDFASSFEDFMNGVGNVIPTEENKQRMKELEQNLSFGSYSSKKAQRATFNKNK